MHPHEGVGGGDGSRRREKWEEKREHKKKQSLVQVRRSPHAATVTESVAQGSDCTVTAGAAATRTDTLWAHNPLCLETEGGRQQGIGQNKI